MTARRRRGLTPEEQALWNRVAEQAVPLHPKRKSPEPAKRIETASPPPAPPIPAFEIGQRRSETALPPGRAGVEPIRMDAKAHARMRRGKLRPEAKIDLHGMTLDRAHSALTSFLLDSHAKNRRLVLVITGKGRKRETDVFLPTHRGILKTQVPHWLDMPPLSQIVLQVSPAHVRHGGEGAYYVYLRRRRE